MKRIWFLLAVILLSSCILRPSEDVTQIGLGQTLSAKPTDTFNYTPTFVPTRTPFPTPTNTPNPTVRFAVIGDYGQAGKPLAAVANLIDSWEVDLIITTGDNNYPAGEASTIDENIGQYFYKYIFPYQGAYGWGEGGWVTQINRFFPTIGNHDWLTDNCQPYIDYFDLPGNERYYDFQWDFIHFFAIDSVQKEPDGSGQFSKQASWLKQTLSQSNALWNVVYFHNAPYSSGYHGDTSYMQWPFEEWGASVVLSGHDHHYERLDINGLTFFVNGLGGGLRYSINTPREGSKIRYQVQHGAMLVTATPTQMTFQFIDIDGRVVDVYTIEKLPGQL